MAKLPGPYQQFQQDHPDIWQAYDSLGATVAAQGPLDTKTRELIKLGMAAAMVAESSVQSHTHRALDSGATPEEIEHAILVGITTMGFPRMMAALTWAKAALRTHGE